MGLRNDLGEIWWDAENTSFGMFWAVKIKSCYSKYNSNSPQSLYLKKKLLHLNANVYVKVHLFTNHCVSSQIILIHNLLVIFRHFPDQGEVMSWLREHVLNSFTNVYGSSASKLKQHEKHLLSIKFNLWQLGPIRLDWEFKRTRLKLGYLGKPKKSAWLLFSKAS